MDWLSALPVWTVPVVVALVLMAESGTIIGLVLPGSSLVLGIGVLVGAGLVPMPVAALTAAAATVAGAAIGHRRAAYLGGPLLPTDGRLGQRLPPRVRRPVQRSAAPWAEAFARQPVRMAAMAQFVVGTRTLSPRLAARSGVPLTTMLRGTIPAALLWSCGLVALGAAAGTAVPQLNGMVTLAGLPVLGAATWLVLHRRPHPDGAPRVRRSPANRRGWWLPTVTAAMGIVSAVAVVLLPCCITDAHATEDRQAASPPATSPGTPAAAPGPPRTDPVRQERVLAEVAAAAAGAGGSIAVVLLDEEGRSVVTGPDANYPLPTASLVKVFVVARLLALHADGLLTLSGDDLALMQRAVTSSDDDAMSTLWTRHDGAQLVRDIATTAQLTGTSPPATPGQWGQTTTTAADVATFLATIDDVLNPADAATLLGWMPPPPPPPPTASTSASGSWLQALAEAPPNRAGCAASRTDGSCTPPASWTTDASWSCWATSRPRPPGRRQQPH